MNLKHFVNFQTYLKIISNLFENIKKKIFWCLMREGEKK